MAPAARVSRVGAAAAAVAFALVGSASAAQAAAKEASKLALLRVREPPRLAGYFLGRFAPGAALHDGDKLPEVELLWPGSDACSKFPEDVPTRDFVAVLGRGNCTVAEQAAAAKQAGAEGMIVVSRTNTTADLWTQQDDFGAAGLFIVGMPNATGTYFLDHCQKYGCQDVRMSVEVYKPLGLFNDVSQLMLVLLATALIVAGAFFATADLRVGSPIAPHHTEVVEVDQRFPLFFCLMGSGVLVVLFFLMRYLIYVIIFCFCVGGASTLTELQYMCLRYRFPPLKRRLCTIPGVGDIDAASVIAFPVAVSITAAWLVWRNTSYGWFFQDIIGAAFLCFIQRTLRLPNMKVACLLLSLMFFFDVFWVFLSPLVFERSVMVEVATGGGTGETVPMLLRIPAIGDPLGRDRMLGFGDIALPGLLVSFLRRHDLLSRRKLTEGYFLPSVIGYFVAMWVTLVALYLMQMGQPALLYLVPGTLGTTLVLAYCRGELWNLWEGRPCRGAQGSRPSRSRDAPPVASPSAACRPGGQPLAPSEHAAEPETCDGSHKPAELGEQDGAASTDGAGSPAAHRRSEDLERSVVTTP